MDDSVEWRPVVGYEGLYEVSSLGEVRAIDRIVPRRTAEGLVAVHRRGGPLAEQFDREYRRVALSRDGRTKAYFVHCLVAEAFHGPRPPGHEVAHRDGVRPNCAASNLRWLTRRENHAEKRRHGTAQTGERNPNRKLTQLQVDEIRQATGSIYTVGARFGVSGCTIANIRRGKTWKTAKD